MFIRVYRPTLLMMGHTYVGIFCHLAFYLNRFQIEFLVLTSHSDVNGDFRQDDTFGWNKCYDALTPPLEDRNYKSLRDAED